MESNDRQSRIEHLPWTKLGDAATWQTQLPRTKRLRYNPLRESMADVFSKKKRSQVMAAIRANGNKDTELRFAAMLRAHGINGWRRNQRLPGKPDFIFRSARVAVFVDGCFWHGCRWHCRMPKSRTDFWASKIARNKERDREVGRLLRKRQWRVLRFWEHNLKSPDKVIDKLRTMLATRTKQP
ncbi:MAG TPA: very short patch repair endonuclease [Verrucomicrobiota bacterium]|nr:very short patch repair endonuclease [Verrucomicrobiota bacterium]HQB17833.1 very short patch repair endonuclease [Verrucomicrobiota bacterium]